MKRAREALGEACSLYSYPFLARAVTSHDVLQVLNPLCCLCLATLLACRSTSGIVV